MKTNLFILAGLLILNAAHAQTPVSQGKLDGPTGSSSNVVYLQGSASPVHADSKPAVKQAVTVSPQTESQSVILSGSAQPLAPNAIPAEKRIILIAPEPANAEPKQISAGAIEEKKD